MQKLKKKKKRRKKRGVQTRRWWFTQDGSQSTARLAHWGKPGRSCGNIGDG
jgi:hypothetical protein